MADSAEHPSLLLEIESRQDEVLRLLDELESKLNRAIRESQLQVVAAPLPQTRAA
ncbi:MAG: hypothetical protein QM811_27390 [Pirellulales bacterium]